VSIWYIIR